MYIAIEMKSIIETTILKKSLLKIIYNFNPLEYINWYKF